MVSKALKIWTIENVIYGVQQGLNGISIVLMLLYSMKGNRFTTSEEAFKIFFEKFKSFDFSQRIGIQHETGGTEDAVMTIVLPTSVDDEYQKCGILNEWRAESGKGKNTGNEINVGPIKSLNKIFSGRIHFEESCR